MNNTKRYFEENSELWIEDAYKTQDYNYPVGLNRLRILDKILENTESKEKILLDIGCGGGDISIAMAQKGFKVIGLDMSSAMLEIAEKRRNELPESISNRLTFKQVDFDKIQDIIEEKSIDVIVAFGFIGYLPNDEIFFEKCSKLLKDRSKLVISCRNRLFNMTSISGYTEKEIKSGEAIGLISELNSMYKDKLPKENVIDFVKNLKATLNSIDIDQIENLLSERNEKAENELKATNLVEPRQQTPERIEAIGKTFGFNAIKSYGVHPHIIVPKLNKMLPPQIFNKISDSLCSFEELPISLVWSSVFITEFEKNTGLEDGACFDNANI